MHGFNHKSQNNHFIWHVVTVLGHTINSDRWNPEASIGYGTYPIEDYIPSTAWCDHLIISDDNYGMHNALPTDMMRNMIVPNKNSNLHAVMVFSIMPQEVKISGYEAEQYSVILAKNIIPKQWTEPESHWMNRLREKKYVCRTHLQKKDNYVKYLNEHNRSITNEQQQFLSKIPTFVWISEITLPHLFTSNKHKLGDIVVNAGSEWDKLTKDNDGFVLAWFPEFILMGKDNLDRQQPNNWGIETHIPIIRNTREKTALEW